MLEDSIVIGGVDGSTTVHYHLGADIRWVDASPQQGEWESHSLQGGVQIDLESYSSSINTFKDDDNLGDSADSHNIIRLTLPFKEVFPITPLLLVTIEFTSFK